MPENIKESDRREVRQILEKLNYSTLIAENKELKEENEELKIIKSGIQALETNFANDDTYYVIGKRGFFKGEYRKLLDDYIPKSKVEELLKEIQEEGKIAYKNFMNKKLEEDFEIDGAILQELGYIEGKLQSLLGKD